MSTWSLPGYEVEDMLGSGASGEVWRARETATGQVVALKRLREGADPSALPALRHEAELLGSLDTPYVVRLRAVVDDVLVLDHAAGGSLAALLARRGCLTPGEAVTVTAPMASALAAVHAAGLVHGDVTPGNVLFTADGMPLLSDLGGARDQGPGAGRDEVRGTAEYVDPAVARGGTPTPASDVWSLGALCHHLLSGTTPHDGATAGHVLAAAAHGGRAPLGLLAPTAPRALVAVVESALSADPAARPSAAALATALQRAQAPAAVRLTGAAPVAASVPPVRETHVVPRPPRPAAEAPRRRPRLPALVGAGVVLLLVMGGLVWSRSGADRPTAAGRPVAGRPVAGRPVAPAAAAPRTAAPRAPASTGPTATPAPAPARSGAAPDWAQVLGGLDDARRQAFAAGNAGLLVRVYAAGSAASAADGAALAALVMAGQTAQGVSHTVHAVDQTSYDGDHASLRVVDVLGPQTVRDASGVTVRTLPGRGEAAHVVDLVRQSDGWRISVLRQT